MTFLVNLTRREHCEHLGPVGVDHMAVRGTDNQLKLHG